MPWRLADGLDRAAPERRGALVDPDPADGDQRTAHLCHLGTETEMSTDESRIGPLQIVLIGFDTTERFRGDIAREIGFLRGRGLLRVIDARFVHRGEDGKLTEVDLNPLLADPPRTGEPDRASAGHERRRQRRHESAGGVPPHGRLRAGGPAEPDRGDRRGRVRGRRAGRAPVGGGPPRDGPQGRRPPAGPGLPDAGGRDGRRLGAARAGRRAGRARARGGHPGQRARRRAGGDRVARGRHRGGARAGGERGRGRARRPRVHPRRPRPRTRSGRSPPRACSRARWSRPRSPRRRTPSATTAS